MPSHSAVLHDITKSSIVLFSISVMCRRVTSPSFLTHTGCLVVSECHKTKQIITAAAATRTLLTQSAAGPDLAAATGQK